MKFDIVNDYGALEPVWLERLEEILPLYAEQEGLPDALVIGLTFCDDDAIRAINMYCELISGSVLDGIQAEMAAAGVDLGAQENAVEEVESDEDKADA